jgi:hypothetical protein
MPDSAPMLGIGASVESLNTQSQHGDNISSASPHDVTMADSSSRLLYEAFASFSLADKCALSLSLSNHNNSINTSDKISETSLDLLEINSFDGSNKFQMNLLYPVKEEDVTVEYLGTNLQQCPLKIGSTPRSIVDAVNDMSSQTNNINNNNNDIRDMISDMQSVISESDKENLDVAMSMMGRQERQLVESEVRIIQSNVRAWLLRKNYINLRESAKVLQSFWRDKKRGHVQNHVLGLGEGGVPTNRRKRSLTDSLQKDVDEYLGSNMTHQSKVDKGAFSTIPLSLDPSSTPMEGMSPQYDHRQIQAAATLQAVTRGMIARKSFASLQRQAMASVVIQKSCISWWSKKTHSSMK